MMVSISSICDFQGGSQPPKDLWIDHPMAGYIRMLQIRDFTQTLTSKKEFVPIKKTLKFCESDDILIARYGASVGKILTGLSGAYNVAIVKTIPNEVKVNKRYLFHYLSSSYFQDYILSVGARAAQAGFNKADLKDALFPLISIDEQKRIATILDSIALLISQHQLQLEKLDILVKSQFIEMFGDRSKYDSVPLNENVEEMFIGPFGSSLKNDCFVSQEESYCMVYEQKHAIKKTMAVETRYVNEAKYRELQRFNVQGGDIIVSCRGTVGEIFLIPDNAPIGIMHPSIMKIRLKSKTYNKVFFTFLLKKYMDDHMLETNGTAVKMAISAKALGRELFSVPPLRVQEHFADIVQQADKSKFTIQQSIGKLETLKKSLMQQYFG